MVRTRNVSFLLSTVEPKMLLERAISVLNITYSPFLILVLYLFVNLWSVIIRSIFHICHCYRLYKETNECK